MPAPESAIEAAATRLRVMALEMSEGAFLGSEEALLQRLGVSTPTIRQAARIVEREGLLKVRRGNSGGYFAARPDPDFIEATMASYLEVLHARPQSLTRVATALWVEAVEEVTCLQDERSRSLANEFRPGLLRIKDGASFSEVIALELKIYRRIFGLIDAPYVELLFNINANYASRHLTEPPGVRDGTPEHAMFLAAWRKAMTMQLAAISDGDVEVAVLAARRCRNLLHQRVWPA